MSTRIHRSAVLLAALAVLPACAAPVFAPARSAVPGAAAGLPTVEAAAATITPERIFSRIDFLAADEMRGRDTPSPELEIAANYLVDQSRIFGLRPGGGDGTYLQRWPFPLRRLSADAARLEVAMPEGPVRLAFGRDFYGVGGTAEPIAGGLVFAGQGSPEGLAEGSLRGEVVLMALPGGFTRDFRIERNRQAGLAQRAGAAAVIHVLDRSWTTDSIARYAGTSQQAVRTLGGAVAFPQFFVTYDAAGRILAGGGLELDALWRGGEATAQPVALTGVTAAAGLPLEELDRAFPPNVVAVLPGSDPVLRDEYVVLTAHFDHIGISQPVNGDSINNGADDNASGTTALLEIARAMSEMAERPRRSVIFLWVSGEEKGLLGSRWYSENPTVPLERIVANINMDMIGGGGPDSVVVIGKDYSSLGPLVNRVSARHPELRLIAADDIWPEQRFFYRSDHFNFARKEIPSIFFFTGVHECYHRPCDQVRRIDMDKTARITQLVMYTTWEIANDPQRPQWDPEGLEEVRRLTR
jgi:hypothetical protein